MGDKVTTDYLFNELEVIDRLDALIDRCIKRLLMVRGVKSITPSGPTGVVNIAQAPNCQIALRKASEECLSPAEEACTLKVYLLCSQLMIVWGQLDRQSELR